MDQDWIDVESVGDKPQCGSFVGYPQGGFMGGSVDFPGTNLEYNGNLTWLICYYKALIPWTENIKKAIVQLQEMYQYIPDTIQQEIQKQMAEVYVILTRFQGMIDENVQYTKDEIQKMNNILLAWQKALAQLEVAVNDILPAAKSYADKQDLYYYQLIMAYLRSFPKEWQPVICPVDGKLEDINTALSHIYAAVGDWITYTDINNLNMTFDKFNQALISYREFNDKASKLVDKFNSNYYMYSPVNGEYLSLKDVIWQLYRLHYAGVTFEYFDGLGFTNDGFNDKNYSYQQLTEGEINND